jgi:superfamily II DNA helicase RecQ
MEETQSQLETLYGPGATYRSPGQRTLIEHILAGNGEIITVLATNEGKSLGFLLPPRLREAGTTVMIVARSRQVCIYVVEALLIACYLPG